MKPSIPRTDARRARLIRLALGGLLVGGLLLAQGGCAADLSSEDGGGEGGLGGGIGGADGGLACGADEYAVGARCVAPPPEDRLGRCGYVESLNAGCQDEDGDCHVVGCTLPLPEALLAQISDCDDRRGDVWAGAEEMCDGRDNDCDGSVDEGYDLAFTCETECGVGVRECSASDPYSAACSTSAGQSQYTPRDERCDGEDDDCDGVIDEQCALLVEDEGTFSGPLRACGGQLFTLLNGDLRHLALPDESFTEPITLDLVPEGDQAQQPACHDDALAWLQPAPDTDGCPEDGPDGPSGCMSSVMLWQLDPEIAPLNLTGLGRHGGLAFGEGLEGDATLYWHTLIEDRPFLKARPIDEVSVEDIGPDLSDPAPGPMGALAVRRWTGDKSEVMLRLPLAGDLLLQGPGDPTGGPQLSAQWLAWPFDVGSVWLQPLDASGPAGAGFQPISDGDASGPVLRDQQLLWLSGESPTYTLHRLDLVTGQRQEVDTGEIPPGGYTTAGDLILYVKAGWLYQTPM